MRPLYETEKDLLAERRFISDIQRLRNIAFIKLPISWKVDGFIKRGQRTIAIAELKIRNIRHDQYPDIIMSEKKFKSAMKLRTHLWGIEKTFQSAKQLQFLFLVRFVDGDYYAEVDKDASSYTVTLGGRTVATREAQDIENVVHIPIGEFKKIEKK